MDAVDAHGNDTGAERREIHFLAALVDQLMRRLHEAGRLSQADLNAIEAAAARVGAAPRTW